MTDGYEHWNEEAERIKHEENDPESPYCDMTDEEIKQAVYERDSYYDDHPPDGCY